MSGSLFAMRALIPVASAAAAVRLVSAPANLAEAQTNRAGRRKTTVCQLGGGGGGGSRHELLKYANYRHDA